MPNPCTNTSQKFHKTPFGHTTPFKAHKPIAKIYELIRL